MNRTLLIGIDPDINKSGFAVWSKVTRKLEVGSERFFDIFDYLTKLKESVLKVRIEAGWLNVKSNWHGGGQSVSVKEKIAKSVGSNHEVGRKFAEMCEYLGLEFELVRPTASKVDSDYFCKLTGIKSSNQDCRDAAMLVFGM